MDIPLVWVEADRPPAKYFLNSLSIHDELFPKQPKYVITNEKFHSNYKNEKVKLIGLESLKKNILTLNFEAINKKWNNKTKQLTYWSNTMKRFFILYDFAKSLQLEKLLHLEGDCILLNNSTLQPYFLDVNQNIYFAKMANGLGNGSIFLVNGNSHLKKFLSFSVSQWEEYDVNDIEILGRYALENKHRNYLPSGDLIRHGDTIFDACHIGQFFLGSDARNSRLPTSRRGYVDPRLGAFKPIHWKLDTKSTESLIRIYDYKLKQQYILGSIHIHSKRIPSNSRKLFKRIQKDIDSHQNYFWRLGVLDWGVIYERFRDSLYRRFRIGSNADFRVR